MSTRSRRIALGSVRSVVAVTAVVGFAACGGNGSAEGTAPTTTAATRSVDRAHSVDLAQGETAGIASQLVTVPGYRYEDPDADEVMSITAMLDAQAEVLGNPDLFRAVSLHSIVSEDPNQNTARAGSGLRETGFLRLIEFAPPPRAGARGDIAKIGTGGFPEVGSFTVAGTKVFVLEDETAPESRYYLVWFRHGVQGIFDGADRAPLERWTRAYLAIPEREPEESDRLAAALKPIPGYVYANWWEDTVLPDLGRIFVGSTASSVHAVSGIDEGVGGLMLADEVTGTLDDLAARAVGSSGSPMESRVVAGVPVRVIASDSSDTVSFVWMRDGIAGAFVGEPASGATFLARFLAA